MHNFPLGLVSFADGLSTDPLRHKMEFLKGRKGGKVGNERRGKGKGGNKGREEGKLNEVKGKEREGRNRKRKRRKMKEKEWKGRE